MRSTSALLLQACAKKHPSMLVTSQVAFQLKGSKTAILIIGKHPGTGKGQLSNMSTVTVCHRKEIIRATWMGVKYLWSRTIILVIRWRYASSKLESWNYPTKSKKEHRLISEKSTQRRESLWLLSITSSKCKWALHRWCLSKALMKVVLRIPSPIQS